MNAHLPFQTRLCHFELPSQPCNLPFAVGGATQHRAEAVRESKNSQDALFIDVTSDVIVGVVTDGCSGTHPRLEATACSSNEVGAKLLGLLVSRAAAYIAIRHPRAPSDQLVAKIERLALQKVRAICRLMTRDSVAYEKFIFDFMMSTVLGFVLRRDRYSVFHCGDGVICVNGKISVLDEHAGNYLANALIDSGSSKLILHADGPISELNSVAIATDGLVNELQEVPMAQFLTSQPPPDQVVNSFDFLLQEFRANVAWRANARFEGEDDATFAVARRVLRCGSPEGDQ